MRGLLPHVPAEILAKMASRSHLLTTGTVPWTVEGFCWACACLVEPTVVKSPYWPMGDRPLRLVQSLHPVRAKLDALRMTAHYPHLAPMLMGRYGIDAGTAHYYRFLAIARFVGASFFHLSASRFLAMVEDTLTFSGQLAESLVKMPYPVPDEPNPYALHAVLQDIQHRKDERIRVQALPEGERVELLVERDYRQGMDLLRSQFAWDLPGYDDAMAYLDDVRVHPERHSWYLRPAAAIDPALVPEWAVVEAYLFHRYGPEVGMAHSLRLAALTEFLDVHEHRLLQEGLGSSLPARDLKWDREFLETLCTMPVAVSGTGKPMFALEGVLHEFTRRRGGGTPSAGLTK